MTTVPPLDVIARHPDRVRGLPRETVFDLFLQAQSVSTVLAIELARGPGASELQAALSTSEAARLLGVSESTLRHGASTLYKGLRLDNGTRRHAWSRPKIEAFIRRP